MAKKAFNVKFHFTSSKAGGDDFSHVVKVEAKDRNAAYILARIVGWDRFGNLFSENCFDWDITEHS